MRPRPLTSLLAATLAAGCARSDAAPRAADAAETTTPAPHAASARAVGWKAVDAAMGRTGTMSLGDVRCYSLPRSDMRVTAAGVPIKPAFALGSWVAFKATDEGAGRWPWATSCWPRTRSPPS
jgi:uncharacterized protein (DUF2252 family)